MGSILPITRLSYVRNEYFETIDAALVAKLAAEWKILLPSRAFVLVIDSASILEGVMLSCVDGQTIRARIINLSVLMDY